MDYRPVVPVTTRWTPNLTRSKLSNYSLTDMNDRGDQLFLASPPEADYRDYVFVSNGKTQKLDRVKPEVRYVLTDSGKLVKRIIPSLVPPSRLPRMQIGPIGQAYNEIRFIRYVNDDGSVLNIKFEMVKKQPVYSLRRDYFGADSKILYTTNQSLTILERDGERVWLRQTPGIDVVDQDKLFLFDQGKMNPVNFPEGYKAIARVAATGDHLAATFGRFQGSQPLRSYRRNGTEWKELPIPSGFEFSFVQKVMDDGIILGFVTDQSLHRFQQVVWKEDSVAVLEDLPAWPRNGQFSFIVRATRGGNIYVRNVNDPVSGSSDYYLLSLKS